MYSKLNFHLTRISLLNQRHRSKELLMYLSLHLIWDTNSLNRKHILLLSLLNHRHRSKVWVCIYRYIWLGILKFFSLTRSRFSRFLLQRHLWRSLGFILYLISPAKCTSRRNVPRRNEFRRSVTGETYRSRKKWL